jgi:hypothetical protein
MRGSVRLNAQDKTGFPDGFDAVEAAPQSHKVLFENAIVRVLQVEVAPGTKEPMHHHRWPSIFVIWDTGGRTGHKGFITRMEVFTISRAVIRRYRLARGASPG